MSYNKGENDQKKMNEEKINQSIYKDFEHKFNPWGYIQRSKSLEKIEKSFYDILIIGGGITGAGIAREAAIKGLKFCLIDKNDFSYGTSSKSSKLAHGGFRYLANYEFKLVRESTTERNWLYKAFSNLVRPVGFVLTAYAGSYDTLKKIKIGVKLYDFISNFLSKYKSPEKHKFFSSEEIKKLEPIVKQEGLLGGAIYYDTNIDDARLTIETIKDALAISCNKEVPEKTYLEVAAFRREGKNYEDSTNSRLESVALSYCKFLGFADEDNNFSQKYSFYADGLKNSESKDTENFSDRKEKRSKYQDNKRSPYRVCYVQDQISGITYTIKTKLVVNATGIWNDEVLNACRLQKSYIRPTKGVHLVIRTDRLGNKNAFGLRSIDDKRFFFVLRREEFTYIGTTDTDFKEDIEEPVCDKQDCDYLLNTVNYYFPEAHLTYKDIVATYAGVRPLVKQEGKSESKVSRKHVIIDHGNNFISICGGKLTIFRKMAEDLFVFLKKRGYLNLYRANKQFKEKQNYRDNSRTKQKYSFKDLSKRNLSRKDFIIAIDKKNLERFYKLDLNSLQLLTGLKSIDKKYFKYLLQQYGKGAFHIIKLIKNEPALGRKLIEDCFLTYAEIVYFVRFEMALTISDILSRRTECSVIVPYQKQELLAEKVSQFLSDYFNFDKEDLALQKRRYLDFIEKSNRFLILENA